MIGYNNVVDAVKKVNRQAALVMSRELLLLKKRDKLFHTEDGIRIYSCGPNDQAASLMDAFFWKATPQGHDYWSDIHDKIHENGGYNP